MYDKSDHMEVGWALILEVFHVCSNVSYVIELIWIYWRY